uniref:Uncharacterized protein n=1 Tax=Anguilla anguilla TaxID=7936 RepID=A0A0E9U328_ANGAN
MIFIGGNVIQKSRKTRISHYTTYKIKDASSEGRALIAGEKPSTCSNYAPDPFLLINAKG